VKPDPITKALTMPEAAVIITNAVPDAAEETRAPVATCADVEADAKKRFDAWNKKEGEDRQFQEPFAYARTIADLDGDGIPEIEWEFSQPPMTVESHIYRGGACPMVHMASLETGGAEVDPATHDGHADFRTEDYASFCEGNPCGCVPEIRHYVWMGTEYREDLTRRQQGHTNQCE
jgi:hypothetical protein